MTERDDLDSIQTKEWLDSIDNILDYDTVERAEFLVKQVATRLSQKSGKSIISSINFDYINTISLDKQVKYPGDKEIEQKIAAYIRWNATAMVVKANKESGELGGHISSYASSSSLYEVGFNHFFRGAHDQFLGDLLYIQGHSSPGIYARAFLEGRISEEQLEKFRQEVAGGGLSSYPHPWLMGDFWQFPTVSMGLGPLQAIYQAR